MHVRVLLASLAAIALNATAADDLVTAVKNRDPNAPPAENPFAKKPPAPSGPEWIVTVGVQRINTKFSLPASPYDNHSTSATATIIRKIDPLTYVGGNLSYDHTRIYSGISDGHGTTNTPSGSVFLMRNISPDLLVDASLGYGKVALDNSYLNGAARTAYSSNTNFLMASAGITKTFSLDKSVNGTLSARYTHIRSKAASYGDSTGAYWPGMTTSLGFMTLGGGLKWRVSQELEPYVQLNWNVSNKEFANGTGDKNYFGYTVGVDIPISPKSKLNLGYTGTANKAYTRTDGFVLSVTSMF